MEGPNESGRTTWSICVEGGGSIFPSPQNNNWSEQHILWHLGALVEKTCFLRFQVGSLQNRAPPHRDGSPCGRVEYP